jgi:hypothetical protein
VNLRRLSIAGCMLAEVLVACARPGQRALPPGHQARTESPMRIPAATRHDRHLTLQTLQDLFFVHADSTAAVAMPASENAYRTYVRYAVQRANFYRVLLPRLFPSFEQGIKLVRTLRPATSASGVRFFYAQKPCTEHELESVRPWWLANGEVLVCRDDHRPTVLTGKDGSVSCDQQYNPIAPESGCGCGPRLAFCAPSEWSERLTRSAREEVESSVQYVVAQDRPFRDLFTMNETVRSGIGEFFYARNALFQNGSFVPPELDTQLRPRPRASMFQGGILTTPPFLFAESRRELLASLWSDLLCLPFRSSEVDAHTLLDAGRNQADLRTHSNLSLAAMRGCQNCHARLEYGQLAFGGWTNAYVGQHFDASKFAAAPETKFFGRDHLDVRGQGPSTVAWFGDVLTSQPEFASCVTTRILTFVFEGPFSNPASHARLSAEFRAHGSLARLIEAAVLERARSELAFATSSERTE